MNEVLRDTSLLQVPKIEGGLNNLQLESGKGFATKDVLDVDEIDPIHLLPKDLEIRKWDVNSNGNKLYSVTFPGLYLSGNRFIDFLSSIAPSPVEFTKEEEQATKRNVIYADWGIMRFVKNGSKRFTNLANAHSRLGEYWTEMTEHTLEPFLAALDAPSSEEVQYLLDSEKKIILRKEDAIKYFPIVIEEATNDFGHTPYSYGLRNALKLSYPEIAVWLKRERGIGLNKFVDTVFKGSAEDVFRLANELPDELKEQCLEMNLSRIGKRILVDPNLKEGEVQPIPFPILPKEYNFHAPLSGDRQKRETLRLEYGEDGSALLRYLDSFISLDLRRPNPKEKGRYIQNYVPGAIQPNITWIRNSNTGRRVYLSPLAARNLPPWYNGAQANAGLLMTQYLDPIELPKELQIKGSGKANKMMEAQMPLLASLSRRRMMLKEVYDIFENAVN